MSRALELGYKLGVAAQQIGGIKPLENDKQPSPTAIVNPPSHDLANQMGSMPAKAPANTNKTQWTQGSSTQAPSQVSGNFDAVKKIHENSNPGQPFNYARNDRTGQTISQVSPTVIKPSGRNPDDVQAELTADYNRKQLMRKQKTEADMQQMRQNMDARSSQANAVAAGTMPASALLKARNEAHASKTPAAPAAAASTPAVPPPPPPMYSPNKGILDTSFGAVNPEVRNQIGQETANKLTEQRSQFNRDIAGARSARITTDANRLKEQAGAREEHAWGNMTPKQRMEAIYSGKVKPAKGLALPRERTPAFNAEMERLKQRDMTIAGGQADIRRQADEAMDTEHYRRANKQQQMTGKAPDIQTRLHDDSSFAKNPTEALWQAAMPRASDLPALSNDPNMRRWDIFRPKYDPNALSERTPGGRVAAVTAKNDMFNSPEAIKFMAKKPETWRRMSGSKEDPATIRARAIEYPQLAEQMRNRHKVQPGKWWKENVWEPMTDWQPAMTTEGRQSILPLPRPARRIAQDIGNFWEAPIKSISENMQSKTGAYILGECVARMETI